MKYVIKFNMDDKSREELNSRISDIADYSIITLSYIPLVFVIGGIFQIYIGDIGVWKGFCKIVIYSSIIGLLIMCIDILDNCCSLTWEDIRGRDKKYVSDEVKKSIIFILCWIVNIFMFAYLGNL